MGQSDRVHSGLRWLCGRSGQRVAFPIFGIREWRRLEAVILVTTFAYNLFSASFLVPYWISLLLAGLPIFYLELSIGQFSSLGANKLYEKLSPIFTGTSLMRLRALKKSLRRRLGDGDGLVPGLHLLQRYHCMGTHLFWCLLPVTIAVGHMRR